MIEKEGGELVYFDLEAPDKNIDFYITKFSSKTLGEVSVVGITGSESDFGGLFGVRPDNFTGVGFSQDWKQNFTVGLMPFLDAPLSFEPNVVEGGRVSEALLAKAHHIATFAKSRTSGTVVVTGHSQGGAIAGVVSAALYDVIGEKSQIVQTTFASPGSGGVVFSHYYGKRFAGRNYINTVDVVPWTEIATELKRVGKNRAFRGKLGGHAMVSGYLQHVFGQ